MKQFAKTTSIWRHTAFQTVVSLLLVGCATTRENTDEPAEKEPTPIVSTTIQHEDDAVVALYQESNSSGTDTATNSRTKASSGNVPKPETAQIDAPTDSTSKDLAKEIPVDLSTSDDQPRRTSMPSRDQKKKIATRVGGVRKAVVVDVAASELFGKWKVDPEKSSAGFLRADAVLFLPDGRMRIWRDKSVEDGRWSWNKSDGLKSGGLDGVPFSLGAFEIVDGTVVITSEDDKRIVLTPDRIFIAPPRTLNPLNNSEKVQGQAP